MSAVCKPLPGQAVCHPLPLFGPMSTRCPLCCGFTSRDDAAHRAVAAELERRVFGDVS